ncbi:peroxisomal membrane protein 13-like isoform X2 [Salvia splendens]|uniref:peroxisomal membrane protein 13-like isoform X2 n=1 Tax=Salvia splendens TaxID=180675 RepID=UPI001C269BA8|nr:peroxisomal membrane protein 13-like isoform X2 [Salvia splendens]
MHTEFCFIFADQFVISLYSRFEDPSRQWKTTAKQPVIVLLVGNFQLLARSHTAKRIPYVYRFNWCRAFVAYSFISILEAVIFLTSGPPPKPWERAGSSSGPAPFRPPSAGNTSEVVEASGTAQPGEVVSTTNINVNRNTVNSVGRPVPARPWEQQQTYGSTYGGYGTGVNYNSGYGGGMYRNSMYRGGYSGLYGGGSMYGGGMYGGGLGGPMGGYGMGMGGPYGEQDPNNPYGPPSQPPGFWISLMRVMSGVVNFFGRVAILIDQNTQAFHMFMSALLQLFDRSGMLYGELARFVLRMLGVRTKSKRVHPPGAESLPGPHNMPGNQNYIEGPKAAPSGGWDSVWG